MFESLQNPSRQDYDKGTNVVVQSPFQPEVLGSKGAKGQEAGAVYKLFYNTNIYYSLLDDYATLCPALAMLVSIKTVDLNAPPSSQNRNLYKKWIDLKRDMKACKTRWDQSGRNNPDSWPNFCPKEPFT